MEVVAAVVPVVFVADVLVGFFVVFLPGSVFVVTTFGFG
jgi:hypothetical protein